MRIFYTIILITISTLLHSCFENNSKNSSIGQEIKLMRHVVAVQKNDSSIKADFNSPLKIVTYGDLYCKPCWDRMTVWKDFIDEYKDYPHLSFLCYLNADKEDFERINATEKLNFPVILDSRSRFKSVNGMIGKKIGPTSFLINEKNEILVEGGPFDQETMKLYKDIIENYKVF